jgi:hypothetical protein
MCPLLGHYLTCVGSPMARSASFHFSSLTMQVRGVLCGVLDLTWASAKTYSLQDLSANPHDHSANRNESQYIMEHASASDYVCFAVH